VTTRSASLPAPAAGLFALASVIDIAFLAAIGSKNAAPLPVILLFALLGLGTLAALVPARRGIRPALFFAGAPVWVMAGEGVVIVSTVLALVLMRRRPAVTMPA